MISCIVPVFNGEAYVGAALESILAQSYRPLEIIVVDDGSTDGTAEAIAPFGATVRYLQQSNQGPAAARNSGIYLVTGEFVAFLDADDLWHPQKLERQMERFRNRPELDYCVTHVQNFWVPELRDEAARYRDHRISQPLPGYVTGTLMARRATFERVGLFNANLGHGDSTDWFLRASRSGAVSELLPDVLLYRRLHQSNRSRVRAAISREEFLQIVKVTLDRKRIAEPRS